MLKKVDFPAPFGPITECIEPTSTSKFTLFTADTFPKFLDKLLIFNIFLIFILLKEKLTFFYKIF